MLGIRCAEGFSIPVGFKFNPTDEEVMKHYLLPAIHQQELPCSFLREFNIYGDEDKEPWKLFGEKGKVDVWVITELKNKSAVKIERTAGCGTWDGQNNNAILDADGKEIGRKKYFNFKCDDVSKLKGQWAMHEYSNKHYNYAIVHIQNNEGMKKYMLPNIKHRRRKEIMLGVDCAEGFRIPPGYRFDPTDEEVIKCYLIPSIHQQELPCNILHKLEIYGEETEPWKLFGEQGINGVWVLARVKNKSKSKIERSVGCGTWNGQSNYPIEDADEKVIGRKRYFKFECKDRSKLKGQWVMHEYALEDYKFNYVICHIENTKDPKKKKQKASSSICEDEHRLCHKRLCSHIASPLEIDQSMMFTNTCSNQCYQQQSYQNGGNSDGNGGYFNLEAETQNMTCTAQNSNPSMYYNLESNTYVDEAQLPTANHQQPATIAYQHGAVENQREECTAELEKQTVSSPLGEELSEADFMELFDLINEEEESSTQLQHMTDQPADAQNQGEICKDDLFGRLENQGNEEETCNHEVDQTPWQPLENQEGLKEVFDNQVCEEMHTVKELMSVAELMELWDQIP